MFLGANDDINLYTLKLKLKLKYQQPVMAATAQTLVKDIGGLVSLPEVVSRVNEMVDDEHSSAKEIGDVIAHDPALSTRLLKIANSPMYGSSRQIESIARAVTMLGTKQIRDLALSSMAAKAFDGIPNDLISVGDFWHHSIYCALLARAFANKTKAIDGDTLFTAGLLHDIGHLVLFNRVPQKAHDIILLTIQGEASLSLIDAERKILGFDHTEIGAELAKNWHLPEVLIECIAYHHEPANAVHYPKQVAYVHIANAIASLPYSDIPEEEDLQRVDVNAWQQAGLHISDIGECIQTAQSQINDMQELLFN